MEKTERLELDPPPLYPTNGFDEQNLAANVPQNDNTPRTIIGAHHVYSPLGSKPTSMVCPCCKQTIQTKVMFEPGSKTHFACVVLCLLQCYLCCFLPYYMSSCMNGIHTCPNCDAYIGTE